jgi:DNA-binding IclR family transcriptional regulator
VTAHKDERHPPSRDQLRIRIAGEFRDMAGLSLTLPQASRLFGLETAMCERLLNELVAAGFLQRRQDGSYERTG